MKVKQFSYFKTREIKVNKGMLYRFVDRFISVRDIKKNKNSNQKTRFVLFMFTAVDQLNRDSSWGAGRLSLSTKVLLIFLFFSYFLVQSFLFFLFS